MSSTSGSKGNFPITITAKDVGIDQSIAKLNRLSQALKQTGTAVKQSTQMIGQFGTGLATFGRSAQQMNQGLGQGAASATRFNQAVSTSVNTLRSGQTTLTSFMNTQRQTVSTTQQAAQAQTTLSASTTRLNQSFQQTSMTLSRASGQMMNLSRSVTQEATAMRNATANTRMYNSENMKVASSTNAASSAADQSTGSYNRAGNAIGGVARMMTGTVMSSTMLALSFQEMIGMNAMLASSQEKVAELQQEYNEALAEGGEESKEAIRLDKQLSDAKRGLAYTQRNANFAMGDALFFIIMMTTSVSSKLIPALRNWSETTKKIHTGWDKFTDVISAMPSRFGKLTSAIGLTNAATAAHSSVLTAAGTASTGAAAKTGALTTSQTALAASMARSSAATTLTTTRIGALTVVENANTVSTGRMSLSHGIAGTVMGGVTAATTFLTGAIGRLTIAMRTAMLSLGPIGIAIALIGAALVAISTDFLGVRTRLEEFGEEVGDQIPVLQPYLSALQGIGAQLGLTGESAEEAEGHFADAAEGFDNNFKMMTEAVDPFVTSVEQTLNVLGQLGEAAVKAGGEMVDSFVRWVTEGVRFLTNIDNWTKAWNGLVNAATVAGNDAVNAITSIINNMGAFIFGNELFVDLVGAAQWAGEQSYLTIKSWIEYLDGSVIQPLATAIQEKLVKPLQESVPKPATVGPSAVVAADVDAKNRDLAPIHTPTATNPAGVDQAAIDEFFATSEQMKPGRNRLDTAFNGSQRALEQIDEAQKISEGIEIPKPPPQTGPDMSQLNPPGPATSAFNVPLNPNEGVGTDLRKAGENLFNPQAAEAATAQVSAFDKAKASIKGYATELTKAIDQEKDHAASMTEAVSRAAENVSATEQLALAYAGNKKALALYSEQLFQQVLVEEAVKGKNLELQNSLVGYSLALQDTAFQEELVKQGRLEQEKVLQDMEVSILKNQGALQKYSQQVAEGTILDRAFTLGQQEQQKALLDTIVAASSAKGTYTELSSQIKLGTIQTAAFTKGFEESKLSILQNTVAINEQQGAFNGWIVMVQKGAVTSNAFAQGVLSQKEALAQNYEALFESIGALTEFQNQLSTGLPQGIAFAQTLVDMGRAAEEMEVKLAVAVATLMFTQAEFRTSLQETGNAMIDLNNAVKPTIASIVDFSSKTALAFTEGRQAAQDWKTGMIESANATAGLFLETTLLADEMGITLPPAIMESVSSMQEFMELTLKTPEAIGKMRDELKGLYDGLTSGLVDAFNKGESELNDSVEKFFDDLGVDINNGVQEAIEFDTGVKAFDKMAKTLVSGLIGVSDTIGAEDFTEFKDNITEKLEDVMGRALDDLPEGPLKTKIQTSMQAIIKLIANATPEQMNSPTFITTLLSGIGTNLMTLKADANSFKVTWNDLMAAMINGNLGKVSELLVTATTNGGKFANLSFQPIVTQVDAVAKSADQATEALDAMGKALIKSSGGSMDTKEFNKRMTGFENEAPTGAVVLDETGQQTTSFGAESTTAGGIGGGGGGAGGIQATIDTAIASLDQLKAKVDTVMVGVQASVATGMASAFASATQYFGLIGAASLVVATSVTTNYNTANANANGVLNMMLASATAFFTAIGTASLPVATGVTTNYNTANANANGVLNMMLASATAFFAAIGAAALVIATSVTTHYNTANANANGVLGMMQASAAAFFAAIGASALVVATEVTTHYNTANDNANGILATMEQQAAARFQAIGDSADVVPEAVDEHFGKAADDGINLIDALERSAVDSFDAIASAAMEAADAVAEIGASAENATSAVEQLKSSIDNLEDKTITITYRIRTVGSAPSGAGQFGLNATVDKPSLFLAGEGMGKERVKIQPGTQPFVEDFRKEMEQKFSNGFSATSNNTNTTSNTNTSSTSSNSIAISDDASRVEMNKGGRRMIVDGKTGTVIMINDSSSSSGGNGGGGQGQQQGGNSNQVYAPGYFDEAGAGGGSGSAGGSSSTSNQFTDERGNNFNYQSDVNTRSNVSPQPGSTTTGGGSGSGGTGGNGGGTNGVSQSQTSTQSGSGQNIYYQRQTNNGQTRINTNIPMSQGMVSNSNASIGNVAPSSAFSSDPRSRLLVRGDPMGHGNTRLVHDTPVEIHIDIGSSTCMKKLARILTEEIGLHSSGYYG